MLSDLSQAWGTVAVRRSLLSSGACAFVGPPQGVELDCCNWGNSVGGMKLFMKSMGYILHRRIFSCFFAGGGAGQEWLPAF